MHDTNLLEDQPIAWTPTPDIIERAQLTRFMKQVGVSTWDELYEFSIRDVEKFTDEVLKFLDIKFDPAYSKLLDTSGGIEFPRWFAVDPPPRHGDAEAETRPVGRVLVENSDPDGMSESDSSELPPRQPKRLTPLLNKEGSSRESVPGAVATGDVSNAERGMRNAESAGLNITTMCLDRWQTDEMKDQPAVIWEGEGGRCFTESFEELYRTVQATAAGLRASGLGAGDAIGIHMPMMPETVIALLAIGRIGAIAIPVFSGYGVEAIASRLNAVAARALFTCDGFPRRGKPFHALEVADEAVANCLTVKHVFVQHRLNASVVDFSPKHASIPFLTFLDLLELGEHGLSQKDDARERKAEERARVSALTYPEPTSAEDPLIILYTSGTTGKPKGIAHTHASFPIKAAQDMAFGTDVGRGTRISWYTDIGWMMGPWLIYGALINGATICIYDGAPDYPTPDRMWEFCAKHKVEVLGISPTLVRALAAHESTLGNDSNHPADEVSAPLLFQGGESHENSPPYKGGVAAASADGLVLPVATSNDEFLQGREAAHEAETRPVGRVLSTDPNLDETKGGFPESREDAKEESDSSELPPLQPKRLTPLLNKEGSSYKPPFERHDLSSLRAFASTGEPWNPAPWWWLFEKVGNSKLPIINYSGGTEIAGGILMGNPLLPIKPCSFPAPCPGMDVDILDENGQPVKPGQVGELVIKQPWVGMARGFWQEKERYLETYWRRFPNIWVHGDWAMRDADGHWFILGRSDDTLKVAGKRVGPAEVESLLVAHPRVTEAAVIGVPDEAKGTAMVAFCVLSDSLPPRHSDAEETTDSVLVGTKDQGQETSSSELEAELRALVAKDMGKPLAPSKIHFVSALPKTRNAKVMRRVIRSAYLGEDAGDLSALENPGAIDEMKDQGR